MPAQGLCYCDRTYWSTPLKSGLESMPAQGLCYCDLESELPLVPALKKYLDQCEQSQSKAVEAAIRRTKAFRNWLAERANS